MTPVGLGTLLGFVNVIVIGFGLTVATRDTTAGVAILVAIFGAIPGVTVGGFLGFIAGQLDAQPRWLRLAVLSIPAVCAVGILAAYFDMTQYAPVACIPTLVATLILERATRRGPLVPVARVEQSLRVAR